MYIYIYIYEKSTIQLTSVGLTQACSDPIINFPVMQGPTTIYMDPLVTDVNTSFIRNKSGNYGYVHTHSINNDHMRSARMYVKRNDQNNYKFSASCGQPYSPLIPSLSYGCKHIFHQKQVWLLCMHTASPLTMFT